MLVDTHCHFEKAFFLNGLEGQLQRAEEAGVSQMITVGTSISDWSLYAALSEQFPRLLHYTVGIHPSNVQPDWEIQFADLESFWNRPTKPVALGEIGLDYFRLPSDAQERDQLIELQRAAFEAQLAFAKSKGCPIVIHSRAAVPETIAMIDRSGVDWSHVVFHCFADGPELIRPLLERGGRASFTGILTFKAASPVRASALEQGLPLLMLETDAPYLAPDPHRGKPCEPAYLRHTAEYAAKMFGVDFQSLADVSSRNARAFYRLPNPQ